MPRKRKQVDTLDLEGLAKVIREALAAIIHDPKAKPEQKLRAAELGVKFLAVQKKGSSAHGSESFFP